MDVYEGLISVNKQKGSTCVSSRDEQTEKNISHIKKAKQVGENVTFPHLPPYRRQRPPKRPNPNRVDIKSQNIDTEEHTPALLKWRPLKTNNRATECTRV